MRLLDRLASSYLFHRLAVGRYTRRRASLAAHDYTPQPASFYKACYADGEYACWVTEHAQVAGVRRAASLGRVSPRAWARRLGSRRVEDEMPRTRGSAWTSATCPPAHDARPRPVAVAPEAVRSSEVYNALV